MQLNGEFSSILPSEA